MATKTPRVYEDKGHPELWGPGMELQSVRDAYDELPLDQRVGKVPAPRQSPEDAR